MQTLNNKLDNIVQLLIFELVNILNSDKSGGIRCYNIAFVRQRGVASELSSAIPAAISTCESLEELISTYLPAGDSLSTTLSSPQFSQALSLFWSALQSGQAAPVVQQFGLGSEAVNAATTGNIHDFVNALETEALKKSPASDAEAVDNSDMMNTKKSQDESAGKLKSDQPDSKTDTINHKKDNDDDEGMALD
ncbi:hypothetical protein TSAR_009698 [Trichomalopsis sarcophagae]|uniref:DEUBAD domain-containing protein n=1 Tax=Trichomalopsis sarcophagae TaxID=543379 RepID=A0A232EZZ5_9HYME|nr:hypothetical protein TSAR_009698 [Trichomalopsis sarcophagae]